MPSPLAGRPLTLPRVVSYPEYQSSAASEVIDLMDQLRRPLDPWQQFVITHGLGQRWDGDRDPDTGLPTPRWAASRCGCWVPRQNGKGDIIMALELGWLYLFKTPLVVHSAHEYKTAQEAFLRIKGMAQGTDWLDRMVLRYWQAAGEQGLELKRDKKTGISPRLRFMARTRGAGRGFSAGKVVLDEGQELTEAQMRAILPVVSAQPNWQIWFFGTPPSPGDAAELTSDAWIYNLKRAGEERAPRTMWIDYGLETIDLEDRRQREILKDPATWARTNPAKGIRIEEETIADELALMGPGLSFAMERCGMWLPERRKEGEFAIDPDKWAKSIVLEGSRAFPRRLSIAFSVNPKRTHYTIGYAGFHEDGRWQVGVLQHRPGVGDLLETLLRLKQQLNPVAVTVDAKSEKTIEELAQRGIRLSEDVETPVRGDLILPTMGDVATAYGLLVDAANQEKLWHHDEHPLNRAIEAPPRPLAGGSTWDHKRGIEVGPANCAGLAMWAHRIRDPLVKEEPYNPLSNIF